MKTSKRVNSQECIFRKRKSPANLIQDYFHHLKSPKITFLLLFCCSSNVLFGFTILKPALQVFQVSFPIWKSFKTSPFLQEYFLKFDESINSNPFWQRAAFFYSVASSILRFFFLSIILYVYIALGILISFFYSRGKKKNYNNINSTSFS